MPNAKLAVVTPNLASFATQYASGDVLGGVTEVPLAVDNDGALAKLISLVVTDKSDQKAAIDFLFFSQAPDNSVGADNAAYALNDADLQYLLGRVSVGTADYVSSSTNNAEASIKNIELILKAKVKTRSVYILPVSRGTPTYGSASALMIKLGLEQY